MNQNPSTTIRVWDPVVRIGHWTLVACFFIAYFTDDDFLIAHVWAGYLLGAVVLFRIVWGFVGTAHARFSDFVYSPSAIRAYLKSLFKGPVQHFEGHNPAGGIVIVLMLILLLGTVYTGLELYAIEENAGPLATLSSSTADIAATGILVPAAYADDDDEDEDKDVGGQEEAEEFWEELHDLLANLTLLLVFIHISGVIVSSYLHKENLVRAMLTGKKLRR